MASLPERLPENAPGRYYVDATCIDCEQCRAMAPEIFNRDPDTGLSFVQRQPATDDERVLVEEILAGCAVGSIGDDGA